MSHEATTTEHKVLYTEFEHLMRRNLRVAGEHLLQARRKQRTSRIGLYESTEFVVAGGDDNRMPAKEGEWQGLGGSLGCDVDDANDGRRGNFADDDHYEEVAKLSVECYTRCGGSQIA